MKTWIDQLGNRITLPNKLQRIISLVPSKTELLFDLGLDQEVVGITQFCVHPLDKIANKMSVGGTKRFLFNKIDKIQPDMIIANKEENYIAGIAQLQTKYPVWISDVKDLSDSYAMIKDIGDMLSREQEAKVLTERIKQAFSRLHAQRYMPIRIAYFIWRKPYMVVANETFINAMLKEAQLENVFADMQRYPKIDLNQLQAKKPQIILLSSEPYPFKKEHYAELQAVCPDAQIMLVDGQLFSWYGSRLQYAPDYFMQCRGRMRNLYDS